LSLNNFNFVLLSLDPLDSLTLRRLEFEGFFYIIKIQSWKYSRLWLRIKVAEKCIWEFRRISLAEEWIRFFKIKKQPVGVVGW